MDQMKIIIESLLTGSQFEVAINEHDKILMVKSNIQKILGESTAADFRLIVDFYGSLQSEVNAKHKSERKMLIPKIENFLTQCLSDET